MNAVPAKCFGGGGSSFMWDIFSLYSLYNTIQEEKSQNILSQNLCTYTTLSLPQALPSSLPPPPFRRRFVSVALSVVLSENLFERALQLSNDSRARPRERESRITVVKIPARQKVSLVVYSVLLELTFGFGRESCAETERVKRRENKGRERERERCLSFVASECASVRGIVTRLEILTCSAHCSLAYTQYVL